MKMRKGREFYGKNYEEAIQLYKAGISVNEIAKKFNISYSAVYHWVKGIRKPASGNVNLFINYLKSYGPTPAIDIKDKFPKHNELFLITSRRGLPVKRMMMQKKFGEYSVWYYLIGQESELQKRTDMLMEKIKEIKQKLNTALGEFK